MGKLYFSYSTMNAGKSTMLLQAAYNYIERGMLVFLLTAKLDQRAGEGRIASRIGLSMDAHTFEADTNIYDQLCNHLENNDRFACVFVDEAQFLSEEQVWQLARFVDEHNLPVMCYGLRVDFQGNLFPGSSKLLALADELREVRTICHCGKKATMVVRRGADGKAAKDGAQVQIGGNDVYVSLCRRHWREEVGDKTPEPAISKLKGGAIPTADTIVAKRRALGQQELEERSSSLPQELEAGTSSGPLDLCADAPDSPVVVGAGGGLESPK